MSLRRDATLFWVSACMLFFELLVIRWLSAELRIFSYFHNLVLLFAFLGIGLGAALARKRAYLLISFVVLAVLVVLVSLDDYLGIYSLKNISLYLSASLAGTDFFIWYSDPQLLEVERAFAIVVGIGMLLLVMALITVSFIPFGQLMGRLFNEYERPLRAYGINLAGSLVGILVFNGLALFSLPPTTWFAAGGLGCLALVRGRRWQVAAGLLVALCVISVYEPRTPEQWTLWSPYQKLSVSPASTSINRQRVPYGYQISVNSVNYMQITNYSPEFVRRYPSAFPSTEVPYDHYNMPYRFADRPEQVLVVGAGAGNDTAGALRNGAGQVTAVEIDPKIIDIGRELHPEAPFSDPRVRVVNDDARSFFKRTREQYDLIVFGLLDSHTLSSSYSNVRLDNYVYTLESLQEARRLLTPNGVMVLLFEINEADDFIGARFQRMLTEAFGHRPVGFSVRSGFRGFGGTGFVAGNEEVIDRQLAGDARLRSIVDGSEANVARWAGSSIGLATDDWPYLYLEGRRIPLLYFVLFGIVALFAMGGVRAAFGRQQRLEWHFFFLGAGFMLLEVQNISKLALHFGTTWTVNAIVISAILVMIALANYYVMRVRIGSLTPYYGALFAGLLVNFTVPLGVFTGLPPGLKELVLGLITGFPLFFAGIIFSTSFAATENRAAALATNLLGAMAGGLLESVSFLFGIKALLILAFGLYLLSMLTRTSPRATLETTSETDRLLAVVARPGEAV